MPTDKAHINHALHNKEALDYLLPAADRFPDWIATVAFYTALHIVDAVFYAQPGPRKHVQDHGTRERLLKKEKRFTKIAEHYLALSRAASIARYLYDDKKGVDVPVFADYMGPDVVKRELVDYRLRGLAGAAKPFLPNQCQNLLDSF